MAARRCSSCSLDYPNQDSYKTCLRCGSETWPGQKIDPMSGDDLKALVAEAKAVKEASAGTNEQWLVTYNDRTGQNPNGEYRTDAFYTTAYTVEECKDAMNACKRKHGDEDCMVRAVLATGRPPKDGGPVAVTA